MADVKMMKFEEGAVIIKEGEVSKAMYKILKGHAELYVGYGTDKESLIGIIGEQKCFGEFGLLLGKPDIYTVVAYSDLFVMKITEESLGEFITGNQKNVIDMMTNMANAISVMRLQMDLMQEELEETRRVNKAESELKNNIYNSKNVLRQYAIQAGFLKSWGFGNQKDEP